jgi:hypothetical protein
LAATACSRAGAGERIDDDREARVARVAGDHRGEAVKAGLYCLVDAVQKKCHALRR